MRINKIFYVCVSMAALAVAGCAPKEDWFAEYGDAPVTEPSQIMSGALYDDLRLYGGFDGDDAARLGFYTTPPTSSDTPARNIAVILPLSGTYADIGRDIRAAVESAYLQFPAQNAAITFYDSGVDRGAAITSALATRPEIIIGPVFADDVRALRMAKAVETPVLAFSSDADAIGGGVMTMALMPTQSIETIVREMSSDKIRRMVILAPDTTSGRIMAGTALRAGTIYDIDVSGLFYYTEKNSDSIKNAAARASMYAERADANTQTRTILSDILTNEELTDTEQEDLNTQLDKLSKAETIGKAPFDAVLFLGDGADSKTLASFLRYYGVGSRDARFYGTALWDGTDIIGDFTMTGAKFATLPEMSETFSAVFTQMTGHAPGRLASFGYDATNLATGMINSEKTNAAYLLDPSGYRGIDGLIRMTPGGTSERGLRIVRLNGTDLPTTVRGAATNFMRPLYNIDQRKIAPAREIPLISTKIDLDSYIQIPARFKSKYRPVTTPGADTTEIRDLTGVISSGDTGTAISATPDFQPVPIESVRRTYIDTVTVQE